MLSLLVVLAKELKIESGKVGVIVGFVASINHTTSRLLKLRFWTL